jgi:hypothetical protein
MKAAILFSFIQQPARGIIIFIRQQLSVGYNGSSQQHRIYGIGKEVHDPAMMGRKSAML